jgi:kynurenine formamidase
MAVYPGDSEVEIAIHQERDIAGWEVRKLSMGSHTGTHVDAFSHAHASGKNLDQIPLDRFIGMAQCVAPGQGLPTGIGLIFNHHISAERLPDIAAARPQFVGGPSLDETLEKELLAMEALTFDGLANVAELPLDVPFTFCGFPLRIEGGDGSPIRAVALIE